MPAYVAVVHPTTKDAGFMEFNLNDPADMHMFNTMFGFHNQTILDIPLKHGIREWNDNAGFTIMLSTNFDHLINTVTTMAAPLLGMVG